MATHRHAALPDSPPLLRDTPSRLVTAIAASGCRVRQLPQCRVGVGSVLGISLCSNALCACSPHPLCALSLARGASCGMLLRFARVTAAPAPRGRCTNRHNSWTKCRMSNWSSKQYHVALREGWMESPGRILVVVAVSSSRHQLTARALPWSACPSDQQKSQRC